jgi:glyoxylase-like metal-dependent hydrolase (beta-lactamase superfamily II)
MRSSRWRSIVATLSVIACGHVARTSPRFETGVLRDNWYAGDAHCAGTPPIRVHEYNENLYILRQAACTNYEKPFLYLLFGNERALLLDTGAGNVDVASPVDTLLRHWLAKHGQTSIELIVAHTHAHGDHVAGDTQFVHRPNITVIGRDPSAVRAFFKIASWPTDSAVFDLGGRELDILPIPGHQPASIAIYDRRTGILLTGDTFYPGRLYVRDTAAYARSVDRLADFARHHALTHILGTHIENSRTPGRDYRVGTVDQPDEHGLDMTAAQLFELDSVVTSMRGHFVRTIRADFTVWP